MTDYDDADLEADWMIEVFVSSLQRFKTFR